MSTDKLSSPIFLHATFRTCSTWWWAQFRKNPSLKTFYEPLHPNLLDRTHAACYESHHDKPKDRLYRHPKVGQHYFSEYPLQDIGGMPDYLLRFAFSNYIMEEKDIDPELSDYIQGLINIAYQDNKRALLKFNRSTLRAGWLKSQFEGTHIYLNRAPEHIMSSVQSFLNPEGGAISNADFAAFFLIIVGQNSTHQAFQEVAQKYALNAMAQNSWNDILKAYQDRAQKMTSQDLQDIVGFVWFTALAHASNYADIIIDQELMGDAGYRGHIKERIKLETGADVLLDDFKPHHISYPEFRISDEMMGMMKRALRFISHDVKKLTGFKISDQSKGVMISVLK